VVGKHESVGGEVEEDDIDAEETLQSDVHD